METEPRAIRVTAEGPGVLPGKVATRAWRVSIASSWGDGVEGEVVLVPNYRGGLILVAKSEDWAGSAGETAVSTLDAEILAATDSGDKRHLQRMRAAAIFRSRVSKGRVVIPPELVWILSGDSDARDVTVVPIGCEIELWPSGRWYKHLSGEISVDQP